MGVEGNLKMHADIKLGYSCNNNCFHCVILENREVALKKKGTQNRTTEDFKKELLDSKNKGCASVTFTGGEPTLRRDLLELIEFAQQLGYLIGMQTNGRLFYYKEYAKKLSAYNISYVIALHGPDEKTHDEISRVAGSFKQTLTGIKNLLSFKQDVGGKMVLSRKNHALLDETVKLFIDLGIKNISIAFPHISDNERFLEVVPKYTDVIDKVHQSVETVNSANKTLAEENKINIYFECIPLCLMRGYEKHVSELKYLDNHPVEVKLVELPTKDWQDLRKKSKIKFINCCDCVYDKICEGPWKEYPHYYGDTEFKPVQN
jgi:MoaA/NifB/PqqE/SkfB family radical SAM enzyme